LVTKEKDTKELNDPALEENDIQEDFYYVYATLNNSTDDCSFLVTALYELDKIWNLGKEEATKLEVK